MRTPARRERLRFRPHKGLAASIWLDSTRPGLGVWASVMRLAVGASLDSGSGDSGDSGDSGPGSGSDYLVGEASASCWYLSAFTGSPVIASSAASSYHSRAMRPSSPLGWRPPGQRPTSSAAAAISS